MYLDMCMYVHMYTDTCIYQEIGLLDLRVVDQKHTELHPHFPVIFNFPFSFMIHVLSNTVKRMRGTKKRCPEGCCHTVKCFYRGREYKQMDCTVWSGIVP